MPTAVIGVGNIGKPLAQHLVDGGERVVLAAHDASHADAVATNLGDAASAAPVEDAIAQADAVVLAVMFDAIEDLIAEHTDALVGKVIVDPSNPVRLTESGELARMLPDGQSSGSVVAGLLPAGAHYVKAFGTLSAESLASGAKRAPRQAVLFYATDDARAAAAAERLIAAAGFDPVKAGGVADTLRIETGGDLHQYGGLNGQLLDAAAAHAAVARGAV